MIQQIKTEHEVATQAEHSDVKSEQEAMHDDIHPIIAKVLGEPYAELPEDLYIPPAALQVFLENFEGPMDLLLYLIKKHNLDILDIPIAKITAQYMEYIHFMQKMQLDLAAEYLLMAATLAEIKSRMLLPRPPSMVEEDIDPRAELIKRLQEYERFKEAAQDINELPRMGRDTVKAEITLPRLDAPIQKPDIPIDALVAAYHSILARADINSTHTVSREGLSVRDRMGNILDQLNSTENYLDFKKCFEVSEGRAGVVVSFLAILELAKEALIQIIQNEVYGLIYLTLRERYEG